MKYTALIGQPTGHSVSHILYRELIRLAKAPYFYQHIRVDVEKHNFAKAVDAFSTLGFAGLSVTLPYKLDVIELLDSLDATAKAIGAVNTVKLGRNKIGYNTDWAGIARSIRQLTQYNFSTATILGTGGAARAAIYACKQLRIKKIHVCYRQPISHSTQKLMDEAETMGLMLHDYTDIAKYVGKSQLIINATSAGMIEKDLTPFDLGRLSSVNLDDKVFLDAVFNPLETPLLKYFRSNGATTIDGLWMMINQGVDALSIWLDLPIDPTQSELQEIHNLLEKELKHV